MWNSKEILELLLIKRRVHCLSGYVFYSLLFWLLLMSYIRVRLIAVGLGMFSLSLTKCAYIAST